MCRWLMRLHVGVSTLWVDRVSWVYVLRWVLVGPRVSVRESYPGSLGIANGIRRDLVQRGLLRPNTCHKAQRSCHRKYHAFGTSRGRSRDVVGRTSVQRQQRQPLCAWALVVRYMTLEESVWAAAYSAPYCGVRIKGLRVYPRIGRHSLTTEGGNTAWGRCATPCYTSWIAASCISGM